MANENKIWRQPSAQKPATLKPREKPSFAFQQTVATQSGRVLVGELKNAT